MGNLSNPANESLSEFQKKLLERKLVQANNESTSWGKPLIDDQDQRPDPTQI